MLRRTFLANSLLLAACPALASISGRIPIGLNTYCLRAMKWHDVPLLDYTAGLKLDAVFLQDSLDPEAMEPAHWRKIKDYARQLGLHLETGGPAILPKNPEAFDASVRSLTQAAERAAGLGSPIVRSLVASDRDHLPPGTPDQHIETTIRVLKAVRSKVMDLGIKIAIENHKDLQCFETRQVIEGAGPEFVGSYLDTGNPVFVLENPMTTLETLGPYAVTLHLRDTAIYEHPRGVAVQWVPLGEGVVDFKAIVARAREICPPLHIYIKPITGRPPQVLPYLEPEYWRRIPKSRAADLASFIALAKKGLPYDKPMVIEDLQNSPVQKQFVEAVQYQQREHMERSVEYAKKTLDLGVRWRV
jgi:3-oxoisoapionate decarboxylase